LINSITPPKKLKPDLHIPQPYNSSLKIQELHSVKVILRVLLFLTQLTKENVEITTQSKELKI
jgi:hypothetical protein